MLSYLGSAGGMGGRGGLLGGSQQQNTFLKKLTSSMGREPRIIFIFPGLNNRKPPVECLVHAVPGTRPISEESKV